MELVEGGVFLLFRLSRSRDVNLLYSNDNSNKDDTQKLRQRRLQPPKLKVRCNVNEQKPPLALARIGR